MKQEQTKCSAAIKAFVDLIDTVRVEYEYNLEAMKNQDRITQDYLHKLELEGLNYRERSKIATKLAENRKARRTYKDTLELLQPVKDFVEDPKYKSAINALSQLLGQVRKVESNQLRRYYVPKAIDSEIITARNTKSMEQVS